MKIIKPTSLLKTAFIALCGVFTAAVTATADPACVLPTRAQQPFTPPIRIQLPDGTNGIEVNSTGSPASFVKMTLKNVPTGYSVTNGTYVAWCIEAATALCPRDVPQCLNSIYKPLIYSSYDTASLTAGGFSLAGWNQVNYIINNKATWAMAGYNVSEVQAAIWRFVGFNAGEEASILSGGYGFGFPAGNAANVTAIYNQANSLGAAFVPVAGQLLAVVVELPAALQDEVADTDKFKTGQPCIIEVVCTPPGSIGDTVFCDLNSNGIQEAGDLGIPGVTLTLSCITPQGTITKTAVTDGNGKYLFSGLAAGTCTVTVDKTTLPAGCNKDVPNCLNPRTVTLAAGQNFLDADFCFAPSLGSIGDTVFCDLNANGVQEAGDLGLQNVRVFLSCVTATGTVTAFQFTDHNGKYRFDGLAPGVCTVSVDKTTLPAGCNKDVPNCLNPQTVNLGVGQNYLDADFCFAPSLGTIGDTVFCDLNANGIQEAGDLGIPNVKVTLVCGPLTKTAFTGTDGKYLFTDLPAGTCTVTVDKTTLPADCKKDVPNCLNPRTVTLTAGQVFLDADFCFTKDLCVEGVIGPVDLSGLANNYLFYFADGSMDANWQGATKGFAGNVLVDGKIASERTSGGVPFAGTIVTSDSTLGAWQSIINQNPTQAVAIYNQMALLMSSKAKLLSAMATIDGLIVTPGFTNRSATSLDGTNTMNGIPQTIVINVTSGFQVSSKINILGDASDVFILRWDTDSNPANGYQGQVKFQSGGAICPQGGLKASNFVHVAGDINASGGGSNPAAPYPQGPRTNNGTGTLISGAQDFNGGGFFTGYWLTTGDPVTGQTAPLSNAIFVGGWYTCSKKFSLTSGTSGVYVAPNCPGSTTTVSGCVYVDLNCNGIRDGGLGTASQWGIFVINGGDLIMNSSNIVGSVALGPQSTGSTLQKTNISGKFTHDPTSTWDQSNLSKDFKVAGGIMSQSLTQAQNDANTASSSFAAMSPTQTFGNVTSSLTITGNGGLNVIKISSLSYNSKTLTLKGGPGDIFIINVAGGWTFADSKITLNGVTAGQVVFNFPTTGSTIQMYKATNVINGTFLAPYRSVIYHNPASFNGQIIAKGLNIHSDANLTSVPLTVAEPCLPGVTVRLSNGTSTTQVTTATGFLFANVAPSNYSITETIIPAGYSFFRANPGSAGGTAATVAPAVFPAQNAIQNIPIASGTNATGYDFGLKRN